MSRIFVPYREEVLRVGVCMCQASRESSGSTDGALIVLPAIPGKVLRPVLCFRIREYPIPEGTEEAKLISHYRCHFFRDTHLRGMSSLSPLYNAFLTICWLDRNCFSCGESSQHHLLSLWELGEQRCKTTHSGGSGVGDSNHID